MAAEEPPIESPPRRRWRLGLGAAITLGLVVLSAAVGWGILRGQAAPVEALELHDPGSSGMSLDSGTLYVHVLGAVARPGLYILDDPARLVDALAAAGGSIEGADLTAVNLARPLSDGEQVVVPLQGEATAQSPHGSSAIDADGKIDLNTASRDELETLPRIGPALAERILQWREENGRFRAVDDLLAVPGIGEKLLAGLRDKVRV